MLDSANLKHSDAFNEPISDLDNYGFCKLLRDCKPHLRAFKSIGNFPFKPNGVFGGVTIARHHKSVEPWHSESANHAAINHLLHTPSICPLTSKLWLIVPQERYHDFSQYQTADDALLYERAHCAVASSSHKLTIDNWQYFMENGIKLKFTVQLPWTSVLAATREQHQVYNVGSNICDTANVMPASEAYLSEANSRSTALPLDTSRYCKNCKTYSVDFENFELNLFDCVIRVADKLDKIGASNATKSGVSIKFLNCTRNAYMSSWVEIGNQCMFQIIFIAES